MMTRNHDRHIEFSVSGENFSTEGLRPKKITGLQNGFVDFVAAIVKHEHPEIDLTEDGAFGFTSGDPTTLVTRLKSPHVEVMHAWRRAGHAIETGDFSYLPPRAEDQLREIVGFNHRHNTETRFWENNGARNLLAVVNQNTEVTMPATITGTTTLYGELLRIGGDAPPRARIRFLDGFTKSCAVCSRELAREMARRLYETIGVRGRGKWDVKNMRLREFYIEGLTEYRQTSITSAIESLREVTEEHYQSIEDIDAFVADLRGREPENE